MILVGNYNNPQETEEKPSETDNTEGVLTKAHLPGERVVHTTLGKYKLDDDGDIMLLIDKGVNEEIARVKRIK